MIYLRFLEKLEFSKTDLKNGDPDFKRILFYWIRANEKGQNLIRFKLRVFRFYQYSVNTNDPNETQGDAFEIFRVIFIVGHTVHLEDLKYPA